MPDLIQASDQSAKLRMVPHFGDVAMVLQLVRSKAWRELYEGSKKPYWRIFMWLFFAKMELFALATRSIFRYRHGHNTTGAITGVWMLAMTAALNTQHGLGWPLALVPFFSPLLVLVVDMEVLAHHMFVSVKSMPLLVLMVLSAIFQTVHIVGLKVKAGRNNDSNKRGNSWLMHLFPKRFSNKEIWIQAGLEPLLILGIGMIGWQFLDDVVFFSFMAISATSLCLQELADEMYRIYHGRI